MKIEECINASIAIRCKTLEEWNTIIKLAEKAGYLNKVDRVIRLKCKLLNGRKPSNLIGYFGTCISLESANYICVYDRGDIVYTWQATSEYFESEGYTIVDAEDVILSIDKPKKMEIYW